MKIKEKLKKHKKKIIILIIIIAIIVVVKVKNNNSNVEEEKQIETEAIERRTIVKSISSTGTIKTENSQNIVSTLTGSKIVSVNVKEGQLVNPGDVICTFDVSSIKNTLADVSATASIANSQSNLGIETAQRNLNDVSSSRNSTIVNLQQQVAAAEQAYNSAQANLTNLKNQLAAKKAELVTAPEVTTELQPGAENEELAKTQTEIATPSVAEAEILGLEKSISELEMSIPGLKAAYEQSVKALNDTSSQLDSSVAAAQDALKNAQLGSQANNITQNSQIRTYKEQLDKGILTAEVGGTITSLNVKEGEIYAGTTIATISGCDTFIVEAEIDEYDIADIQVGMKALIKTDSTRDEELKGTVTYVAVSPTVSAMGTTVATTSNKATYTVKIALDAQNERLRLGMNAKISIITQNSENVWSVPYDAILDKEDGTHYIEILKDETTNEKEEINVEVGIEGTYYTEVKSDKLADGMKVILPEKDSATSIEDLIVNMGADAGI